MRVTTVFILSLFVFIFSCNKEEVLQNEPSTTVKPTNDKIIIKDDGTVWLYGGPNESEHFNVSNRSFNLTHLKYGLGRETFYALRDPQYIPLVDMNQSIPDESEIILLHANQGTIAYPLELMIKHEVVNDVIDGIPVLVSYCVLADFIGIYSREYCKQVLTFGVSGYTYYEDGIQDGRDGFVLWDRETESLWWPLINSGISGTLEGEHLNKSDLPFTWERTTMYDLRTNYPNSTILNFGQEENPPNGWTRLEEADFDCD